MPLHSVARGTDGEEKTPYVSPRHPISQEGSLKNIHPPNSQPGVKSHRSRREYGVANGYMCKSLVGRVKAAYLTYLDTCQPSAEATSL